jgi:arsenite methyltransferase
MANPASGNNAGLITAFLALVTCYGTLALVAGLALLGFAVPIDEGMWAIAITVLFAASTVIVALGFKVHGVVWPALLAVVGLVLILWTMFAAYSLVVEIGAFVLLFIAAFWDRSLRGRES